MGSRLNKFGGDRRGGVEGNCCWSFEARLGCRLGLLLLGVREVIRQSHSRMMRAFPRFQLVAWCSPANDAAPQAVLLSSPLGATSSPR